MHPTPPAADTAAPPPSAPPAARRLVGRRQPLTWRRASPCPCPRCDADGLPPDPSAARGESLGCPVCGGHGLLWGPPVLGAGFVVTDPEEVRRVAGAAAHVVDGDAMLVLPVGSPLWAVAVGDRIGLGAGEEAFRLRLTRDGRERLPFSVLRATRCAWKRRGAVVEGAVPAVDAASGTLRWSPPAGAPPSGAAYTLEGVRRPECVVARELALVVRDIDGGAPSLRRLLLRRLASFT